MSMASSIRENRRMAAHSPRIPLLPDDLAVQKCGCLLWEQVVVEVEVLRVRWAVSAGQVEGSGRGRPLCREEKGKIVGARILGGTVELLVREVLDWRCLDWVIDVPELRPLELGHCRPRGEYRCLRVALRDDRDCRW